MIQTLKRSSLAALNRLGIGELVARSAWRRNRLLILCYHGISLEDEHAWEPGLYISPQQLERSLQLLRQTHCTVLPLGEAIERLYRHELPDRAVVLTFDDGYYDFQAQAWPLLQRYSCPATVYLTTFRVDHNLPNANLFLSYILWTARDRVLDGTGVTGLNGHYSLDTPAARQAIVRQINRALPIRGSADHAPAERGRDAVAKEIVVRLGLDYDRLLASRVLSLLRPDEVSRLSRDGVDFQLHTHLHRTPADPVDFVDDVLANRERIEALTGRQPSHLCYPSGNYRASYLPLLRQHGIRSATTCDPGIAATTTDPLLLPRFVETSAVSTVVLESWLSGLAPRLPRRTRRGGYIPTEDPARPSPGSV